MASDRPTELTQLTNDSRGESGETAAAGEWGVTVLHSPAADQVGRRIPVRGELRFGRTAGPQVDCEMHDGKMSRRHATLTRRGLIFELRDDGSSNGTYLNGERVEDVSVVGAGDVVRMGATLLLVGPLGPEARPGAAGEPVGRAPAYLAALEYAGRVAAADFPLLLLGETGTGKDVLARHVHARSGRKGGFVAVNCAALPAELAEATLFGHRKGAFTGASGDSPGLFVQAEGGTIFLDEIGELPLHQQAKLLRVLETREVVPVGGSRVVHSDARVVAATNVDLLAASAAGKFRNDLYARLAVVVISLPPLRARRVDILPLAAFFLAEQARGVVHTFSTHAAEILVLAPWPRNIRELRAAMIRLAVARPEGGEISSRGLEAILGEGAGAPAAATAAAAAEGGRGPRKDVPERAELVDRLTALRGNVNRLAEHFGKDPKQIYRWLKRYDLKPEDFR